jgi:hypothetical protein
MSKSNLPVLVPPVAEHLAALTDEDRLAILTADALAAMVKLHIVEARRHTLQAEIARAKLAEAAQPKKTTREQEGGQ